MSLSLSLFIKMMMSYICQDSTLLISFAVISTWVSGGTNSAETKFFEKSAVLFDLWLCSAYCSLIQWLQLKDNMPIHLAMNNEKTTPFMWDWTQQWSFA